MLKLLDCCLPDFFISSKEDILKVRIKCYADCYGFDKSFIKDRFMDGKDYVPRSYFFGATPQNDYTPESYRITVSENPYSYTNEGYAKLFIRSGGADSPREVLLRKAKDGKWYLWEQYLLSDIRQPESANPWA